MNLVPAIVCCAIACGLGIAATILPDLVFIDEDDVTITVGTNTESIDHFEARTGVWRYSREGNSEITEDGDVDCSEYDANACTVRCTVHKAMSIIGIVFSAIGAVLLIVARMKTSKARIPGAVCGLLGGVAFLVVFSSVAALHNGDKDKEEENCGFASGFGIDREYVSNAILNNFTIQWLIFFISRERVFISSSPRLL